MPHQHAWVFSRPKKRVDLEGNVPALKQGAAEAADSTRDIFAMMKTFMETTMQAIEDHKKETNKATMVWISCHKHWNSNVALFWQKSRRKNHTATYR